MNLHPGDKVFFEETKEGEVKITTQKKSILKLRGILHRPGQKKVSIEEMNEGVKNYLAEKYKK